MFLIFLFLIVVCFLIFDGDIMAPSFIFCSMYAFSIGCALVNYQVWGLNIINKEFFKIYVWGAIVFVVIGVICKLIFSPRFADFSKENLKKIQVYKPLTYFFIFIDLITLFLWIVNVYKIAGGISSFSDMMEKFRLETSYSLDVSMPGYLSQLSKIVTATGFIYMFIYINNLLIEKRYFNINLIIPSIYLVFSFFNSNRLNFLELVATFVVYYYFLKNVEVNMGKRSLSLILKLIAAFLLVLVLFYGIRILVGRTDSKDTGLVEYITLYAGGPVKLFNMFLEQPIHSDFWGKETFPAINRLFNEFNLFNVPQYIAHKEFRSYDGIDLGNVYSAYRGWYADFYFKGTMLLQGIFAVFFNSYYYVLRGSNYYSKHMFAVIMYGYLASCIFMHPIDDVFFTDDVSVGFLIYILVFIVVYIISLKKVKIKL
jgi:oligosaccharide repeat unit polymerase